MSELEDLGLLRKTRLVSGPQGPRVVLDGKPTLVLCSSNYLGLADHPRVRQAAAEAAMRWGAGATSARLASGTMTIHRRLEERLAAFLNRESALLFGSGYLAGVGVVAALARPGDVVFADAQCSASLVDGCRLSGAELFSYDHLDAEHLRWGIARVEGRGALIATDSVFSIDGELAPLREIVELARRRRLRVVVDEGHAIGTIGPGGVGAVADAGLEDEVEVVIGTLGGALGSYGGFAACRGDVADYLLNASRTVRFSAAPAPPAAAAALAALALLEERPQMVTKLNANAAVLRGELERRGFHLGYARAAVLSLLVGDPATTVEVAERALAHGVLTEPIFPPVVPALESQLRLTVMASHRREELLQAAEVVDDAYKAVGIDPSSVVELEPEFEPELEQPPTRFFDFEAVQRLAA